MAGGEGEKSLSETPTWAVAVVATVFVLLSVIMEHSIHSLGKWFQKKQKKAMSEALEKIKAELMLLGFLSLLLTVGTQYISKICIPAKLGNIMLPCRSNNNAKKDQINNDKRKLFSNNNNNIPFPDHEFYEILWRRALAEAGTKLDYCASKNPDKVALISYSGVHQLHIFIFVLAVFHVLYSVITIALAKAKMRRWRAWESETSSVEYQFTNDPERFRFARQTSFVRRHSGLSRVPGIRWIVAFFRQFFGSVTKVDYLTMRRGFINAHFAPNAKFDFRRYIKRSMEDDFKRVVGISLPLWIFAIVFLLLNVYKWYTLSWLSLAPFIILLLVGTKLEIIIMEMAEEIQQRSTIVKGGPTVEPNNKYFWFNRPHWILILIHFTLFQNAFQMAYFLWTWYEFGLTSCFHEKLALVVMRVILGVVLQFICSYITFPLYSLVTQMGSHMKQAIFEEQTAKALKNWQRAAKNNKKFRKTKDESTSQSLNTSPVHLLHSHNHRASVDIESSVNSQRFYHSDTDLSDSEHGSVHRTVILKPHRDFSFEKPS